MGIRTLDGAGHPIDEHDGLGARQRTVRTEAAVREALDQPCFGQRADVRRSPVLEGVLLLRRGRLIDIELQHPGGDDGEFRPRKAAVAAEGAVRITADDAGGSEEGHELPAAFRFVREGIEQLSGLAVEQRRQEFDQLVAAHRRVRLEGAVGITGGVPDRGRILAEVIAGIADLEDVRQDELVSLNSGLDCHRAGQHQLAYVALAVLRRIAAVGRIADPLALRRRQAQDAAARHPHGLRLFLAYGRLADVGFQSGLRLRRWSRRRHRAREEHEASLLLQLPLPAQRRAVFLARRDGDRRQHRRLLERDRRSVDGGHLARHAAVQRVVDDGSRLGRERDLYFFLEFLGARDDVRSVCGLRPAQLRRVQDDGAGEAPSSAFSTAAPPAGSLPEPACSCASEASALQRRPSAWLRPKLDVRRFTVSPAAGTAAAAARRARVPSAGAG
ncbi:hypothetical protein BN871_HX_00020 [Paenibacillus sp. P22]|nr:hypothetical protein BN871_HX_00020 [Paenibacillus sp. P22]